MQGEMSIFAMFCTLCALLKRAEHSQNALTGQQCQEQTQMSLPAPAGPRAGHSILVGSLSRRMKQHSSLTSQPCLILLTSLPEHQHNKTLGSAGVNPRLGPWALHSS